MRIWILDPSPTAERWMWIQGWARHSRHSLLAFTLPVPSPRAFRLSPAIAQARAEDLARRIRRHLTGSAAPDPSRRPMGQPDLVILTDGMDGMAFREATADLLAGVPLWIYWHTSRMARPGPLPPEAIAVERRTLQAAQRSLFHGESQRRRVLDALSGDDPALAAEIERRGVVLPPGFEPSPPPPAIHTLPEPLVLWILRGEPEEIPLLAAVLSHPDLQRSPFRVLLLSERPEAEAPRVARLPRGARARILGILSPVDPEARRWIPAARAVVDGSAGLHSPIYLMHLAFQGPWPLVPAGSGFLDGLPPTLRPLCAYEHPGDLAERLAALLRGSHPADPQGVRPALAAWTWSVLAPRYDGLCETARAA